MATRSFPIQILRTHIDNLLNDAIAATKTCLTLDKPVARELHVQLGQNFHLPMDAQRKEPDVVDHLNRTIRRVQNIQGLLDVPNGATEVSLDSSDMADIAFLEAYQSVVDAVVTERNRMRKGG